ncbi:hypothetical protein [Ruminococcus flavefaciens]|uniref:Uncharacterized protein n=1 Tax=Ruminococcus flavefaciens TaxID=1265 RepID=A0A315Y352_RUMFL|nr:hypothetical protein [Ruminococcus flavefaciens]PWJ13988.1 hypothetical protein IE37_00919 [Ruminococcus flavefaciens]SSA43581.1 hypothetical protein SAMN02910325_00919 [Ruminococcus flavefaciens]
MNRDNISKMSLIDLLSKISKGIDECLYQVLSDCKDVEKRSRCEKMSSCYDCLSAWLNEGGKIMFIGDKWYTEPEIKAYITELKKKLSEDTHTQELEAKVKLLQEFLQCVRAYFGTTCGWVDIFEEDAKKLLEGE